MVQNEIEAILGRTLGLDANTIGSRIVARAMEQRQLACHQLSPSAYLELLKSSPQELEQLIEAVVIPETWFFRDTGSFELLGSVIRQPASYQVLWPATDGLRVLSLPCSTGEEPYSIAMTLLDVGMPATQFRIDAIDVSQQAVAKAKRAVYGKKSFRGRFLANRESYFQPTPDGYEALPDLRQAVHFRQGNVLTPHLLAGKRYHVIFCRNLLIYLDQAARRRVIESLDRALVPGGLLFLGAVEMSQMRGWSYRAIAHPRASVYQKQPLTSESSLQPDPDPIHPSPRSNRRSSPTTQAPNPSTAFGEKAVELAPTTALRSPPNAVLSQPPAHLIATAQQLANQGQLAQSAQLCQAYLRTHPPQASVYLLLGEVYQGLNQSQQAERYFQKAIYLNPNTYEALIHLALLKQEQGQPIESARLRRRAQRLIEHPI